MAIQQSETAENQATKYDLIETRYCGNDSRFKGSRGEAYADRITNTWMYRPFGGTTEFFKVGPKDLECSNDKGWLKGKYIGDRPIPKTGKAFWNDTVERWNYKPNEGNREFMVLEENFIPVRDVDVFDKGE